MVNQTRESMSSALEAAAMDLESTSKRSSEPIYTNITNGSTPSINGSSSTMSTNSTGMHDPMSDYIHSTASEDTNTSSSNIPNNTSNVSAIYGNYDDYQLLPDAPWPPPVFVRQDISPQERYYIEHRWYSQWSFFDTKATENKNRYYRTQLIVGIGSVSVPVLVGINAVGIAQQILYFVTVFISLSVAMATAIESLYTFGDNWRSYRSAAEDLRQEKSLYDVKAGKYANNRQAFVRFVERCEEIIAQQNGRWVQSQEKAAEQIREEGAEFVEGMKTDQYGNPLATTATKTTTVTQTEQVSVPMAATESEPESYVQPATEMYEEIAPLADPEPESYVESTPAEEYNGMDTEDPMGPTSYG